MTSDWPLIAEAPPFTVGLSKLLGPPTAPPSFFREILAYAKVNGHVLRRFRVADGSGEHERSLDGDYGAFCFSGRDLDRK